MGATKYVSAFEAMLLSLAACFTAPTRETFLAVATGWVLCLGRPAVTRIVRSAGSRARKHLATYHRFFRAARWSVDDLFLTFVTRILVPLVAPAGKIVLAGDDTTCTKFGRRVAFAGHFRDAVLSTSARTVVRWAHAWVIVTMQVRLPFWPLRTVSFPVMARLYRKEADCDALHPFRARGELLVEMVRKLAPRLPGREFELVADGAYPSRELVKTLPRNVKLVSRIRSDAALYALPPRRRKGQRGRPREKGDRLPRLGEIATRARRWERRVIVMYGRKRVRMLHSFTALWWGVAKARRIKVVIVRDPSGTQKDDFLFTTDLSMKPARVAEIYAMRWGIEEVIREAKQSFGFAEVQGWSEGAVERQAPFALLTLSLVKAWYVGHAASRERPEAMPSAARMLTRLRAAYWGKRISALSLPRREKRQFAEAIESALQAAA